MGTTTSTAQAAGKTISTSSNTDLTRLQEITDSTHWAVSQFPGIASLSNIDMYCRSEWLLETQFNQFGRSGNSRGNNIVCKTVPIPDDILAWKGGRGFYKSYWNDPVIANYREQNGYSAALEDGLFPHGISQAIGAYNIRGCAAAKDMFQRSEYADISNSNGLLVDPGTRVTSVYTDDAIGRRRSILAGVIVIDRWFNFWNGRSMTPRTVKLLMACTRGTVPPTNKVVNPDQALILALGNYVGFSGKDVNGTTGVARAYNVLTNRSWPCTSAGPGDGSGNIANKAKSIGC